MYNFGLIKDTTYMRVVFFVLLIFLISVLVFILLGNRYKVLALFSSKQKSAYYTVNHRFLNFVQGKLIVLEDGSVSIIFKKNWLLKKDVPEGYSKALAKELIKIVKLTRLDIYLESGETKDAFISSITKGAVDSIGGIIIGILTSKSVETKFHHKKSGDKNEYGAAVDLNIKITLLSFIFARIRAKKNYKKEKEKNNEN